ncbi:50S ribosomal protein L13 [Spiroplasma endosymbiont of Labia minor]|uniref:50S ribosomal protein L13 n=1 Tax=Spiroplasma endosymbiont of Labia minor TaxID=3066305 RepID=UPI0030CD2F90
MRQTTLIKMSEIDKKWYIIDAQGLTMGRMATQVAVLLRGKHKPNFTPNINNGDHVIIINADKVEFTGKKESKKLYFHHTLYPGGLRQRNVATQRSLNSTKMVEHAVRLMLPKNVQGSSQFRALHVYADSTHPHQAQNPVEYKIIKKGEIK